jgi:hypothetical protein
MNKQGVLVVLGHKGSGKTQLTRKFLDAVPRSVCIDTIGEYGGVVIEDPYSLSDYLETAKHLERFRVSYRDLGMSGVQPERIFEMLKGLRDCWLCLEEASKWTGPSNTTLDEVKWFLQYGRHNRISVVLVARRPAELDRMGTAQADTIVSFSQHEPRDREYIAKLGGTECADRIAGLGQYEWDYVMDTHPEIRDVLEGFSEEVGSHAELDSGSVGDRGDGGSHDRMVPAETVGERRESGGDRAEGSGSPRVVPASRTNDAGSARGNDLEVANTGKSVAPSSRARGGGRGRKVDIGKR